MAIKTSAKNKTMVVTVSSPPVNAFSSDDLIEMNDLIEKVSFDNQISVIIIENEGKGFSAGADRKEHGLDKEKLERVFSINTFGPAIISRYFIPLLNKEKSSFLGFLSARVGSISDNRIGGWYSYRASKSALNQIIKNFSIEAKRTNPSGIIIGLQPGTVKSKLSEPFQKNVKKGKSFLPEDSVTNLTKVVETVLQNDSGKMFDWEGREIRP